MPTIAAQVTMPMDSAIPADAATNTLYFQGVTATATLDAVQADVTEFYNVAIAGAQKLSQLFANVCATTWPVKLYQLDDVKPRVPVRSFTMEVTTGTTTLPQEVAACLSFQGPLLSGVNQGRRRGRIYLGPLHRAVLDETTGLLGQPYRAQIASSAARLMTSSNVVGHAPWVVHSATSGANTVVTRGWCDDAFDIQRRRGIKALNRSTFGA